MKVNNISRRKKLKLNTLTSVIYEIVLILSGFVVPKLILSHFRSDINGLVSSITQFLSFISLAQLGVGAVVQSAFYKPIVENNSIDISKVFKSSERFFNKVALLLLIYVAVLIIIFPKIDAHQYDFGFTTALILAIAINVFSQYYIDITYRLFINAVQLGFIGFTIGIITNVLNIISCVILIKLHQSIVLVKFVTSIIFLAQPLIIKAYVDKNYNIDHRIILTSEPIQQKWNGLYQHIANVIFENTDVVVLTIFSTFKDVSIYTVYHLVTNGLKLGVSSFTEGTKSLMGDMLAKDERKQLRDFFGKYTWGINFISILIFITCGLVIAPFEMLYTHGVTDANYWRPFFGILLSVAMALYSIRLPYTQIIFSAGHFKETQNASIIEAIVNLGVSILLVYKFGLIGVAIGTIVALLYRTIYCMWYLSKNILYISLKSSLYYLLMDLLIVLTVYISCCKFINIVKSVGQWVGISFVALFYVLIVSLIINMIFKREYVNWGIKKACLIIRNMDINM